ncbi:MAG: hypothetical protein H9535_19245 [Ignavibacteria bacterium]|nr:hypothetical protein [Ignavibacteria bacterium]
MTQDRQGMIWFGTADGLNMYDGVKFTVYRHRKGDTTSLPDNGIMSIVEDKSGTLWVGTKDYLCRFNAARGAFSCLHLPTRVSSINVRAILDGGKGMLYIVVGVSVFQVDKRTFAIRPILDERRLGNASFVASNAAMDARGNIWITTTNGLFVYETARSHLRQVNTLPIKNAMPKLDHDGQLWFTDGTTFFRFDPLQERITISFSSSSFGLPKELPTQWGGYFLCLSADGLLWLHFHQQLFTYNPTTGYMQNHTSAVHRAFNSNSGEFISGFTDRTGVVWLGNSVHGIARWSPYNPKFRLWKHQSGETQSISNNYIRGIWEDSSGIAWVCTQYGGLNRINPRTGKIRHYPSQTNSERNSSRSVSASGLQSSNLWGILPAENNKIWLYKNTATYEMNTATERFRSLPIRPMTTLFQDRDGIKWTSDTANGQSHIGTVSNDGMRFFPKKQMAIDAARLDAALHDRRGRIWFALYQPLLLRYDKVLQMWDTIQLTPALRRTDIFSSLFQDHTNNVWLATKGDGIYCCDTNDCVISITEQDGLPSNNVYGMYEDRRGILWISTDKGVAAYNPATKTFRNYTPNDGLQGWEFNRMAFHQNKNGEIYFGGTDGLNLFHPDSLRDNPHPPPVRMTAIYLMGKPLQSDTAIGDLHSVNVLHQSNTLSFEFAALDFTAPELNKYSWRLDGFDKDWTEPSSKHETKYTNLSPGDYIFRVKACNSDGVWNENGIVLFVTVQPAWYQRWWFLLFCGLALIGSVVMIVRVRVRAVEVQNRLLEVEVHKRTKELREANSEIKRQMEVQDAQAREIELTNSELDMTLQDLKTTQTQLVQSERMNAIGMLTAGVMHEINNPNAIAYSAITQARSKLEEMVKYFLSLLDDESKESAEVRKYQELSNDALSRLELAAEGAGRVKTIVANLQGMTKHQEEGGKTGNLVAELASTFSLFRMQFHTVEIVADTPPDIFIRANFGEINQVFLNLLVNAAQAGATRITMTATQTDSMVVLRMTDNGKGMSAKTASHIFEPFFTTKAAGNSGLGLSISKQIIERHGGEIECESEPDKGTTFIVRLPIVHV